MSDSPKGSAKSFKINIRVAGSPISSTPTFFFLLYKESFTKIKISIKSLIFPFLIAISASIMLGKIVLIISISAAFFPA